MRWEGAAVLLVCLGMAEALKSVRRAWLSPGAAGSNPKSEGADQSAATVSVS
jgi:hypothetical protein